MSAAPILVAHRAGNDPQADVSLFDGADAIELDLHLFRGRFEVRHGKVLWPSSRLFDAGRLLPRSTQRPSLTDVLEAMPPDRSLWIDLKGPDPRLARRAKEQLRDRDELFVSARCWWQLISFDSNVRRFLSIGTRWQRWLALAVVRLGWSGGLVMHSRLVTSDVMDRIPPTTTVIVWDVGDQAGARRLLEHGVAGLIVDGAALIDELRLLFGRSDR